MDTALSVTTNCTEFLLRKKMFLTLTRVYLPLLFAFYIFSNLVLTLNGSALCESEGCKLVDSLTSVKPLYLNILGLLFALSLFFLELLYRKKQKQVFQSLRNILLLNGLVFESILIAFQVFVVKEFCLFCLGVYAFIIVLSFFLLKPSTLLAPTSIFLAFASLQFIPFNATLQDVKTPNTYYIYSSKSCEHCKKLKTYLNEKLIPYIEKDISKAENLFILKYYGIDTIPAMFVKHNQGFEIYVGDQKAINYFQNPSALKQNESIQLFQAESNSIIFNNTAQNEQEGCGLTLPCN